MTFLVRELLARDEVHFGREGCAIVEGLADPVNQQRDVGCCNCVAACFEHVQRITVTEEYCPLTFTHDHL
jgi:hypothetical protein